MLAQLPKAYTYVSIITITALLSLSTNQYELNLFLTNINDLRYSSNTSRNEELSEARNFIGNPVGTCPPNQDGLVVSNLLGRLGNNFFEIGLANLIATSLCWDIIYRPYWQSYFRNDDYKEASLCFPNALLPMPNHTRPEWVERLRLNENLFQEIKYADFITNPSRRAAGNQGADHWNMNMEREHHPWTLRQKKVDFTQTYVADNVTAIALSEVSNNSTANTTTAIHLIYMSAFFIHYDWMSSDFARQQLRHWFALNPVCSPTPPPSADTVVIHIRGHPNHGTDYQVGIYRDILAHYGYTERPIWIVSEPQLARSSPLVQDLLQVFPNAKLELGVSSYDAIGIMKNAKILIPSMGSTFSQIPYFMSAANDMEVHYPLDRLLRPPVTLGVPEWHYHLVNATKSGIEDFNVSMDRIQFIMS